jgi:SWI/SNF-related matrix-associated actin-dependent regulator 1 of chromatin subfamily A
MLILFSRGTLVTAPALPTSGARLLTYNKATHDYVVFSDDEKKAKEIGLTLSTNSHGPNGEKVWSTKIPYAAMPYWEEADARAKERLAPLRKDYENSWRTTWDGPSFPHPSTAPNGDPLDFMPYQNAGIDYGIQHEDVLIGDEPGLGKTGQAIGIANQLQMERVLVICPANIRLNWKKEIHKWSTMPNPRTYPIIKATNGVSPSANFTMVSYELARNEHLHKALCELKWDMIVIDEAHYLKEKSAQRTHAVFGGGRKHIYSKSVLVDQAEKVVALTGTPLPNRPRECFTIANALCPESIDWMTFDEFAFRFNPSGREFNQFTNAVYNREEKGRLPELNARLRSNFMIRRHKKDVLKDLPDKRYELTYIEPTGAIADIIARERMLDFSIDDLSDPFAQIWGQISTIRREMGEAKLPRAIEHIRYLLDVVELPKVLVFFHHREVMDRFRAEMAKYGVVEMRGGMTANAKQKSIDDFISDPTKRIFSGQMDSAGVGIDGLQGVCAHCVVVEAAWVPGVNEQAIDRLHRKGQHGNVVAQFLVVEGSLDERILAAILEKSETIHESIDARH